MQTSTFSTTACTDARRTLQMSSFETQLYPPGFAVFAAFVAVARHNSGKRRMAVRDAATAAGARRRARQAGAMSGVDWQSREQLSSRTQIKPVATGP